MFTSPRRPSVTYVFGEVLDGCNAHLADGVQPRRFRL